MTSYELGYRGQFANNFELNVELFYNKNEDLIGQYKIDKVITKDNLLDIDTFGLETSINYRPYHWWHIRATHGYAKQPNDERLNDDARDIKVYSIPQHTTTLMNRFYLDSNTTINTQLFYNSRYFDRKNAVERVSIGAIKRFDIRLSRKFFIYNTDVEFAIGGSNINEKLRTESGLEVPRLFYFQALVRY